jgi:hypothetical protein
MAGDSAKKIEETKKCLSIIKMLRQQMSALRGLSLINIERQYLDASFAHTDRLQNSLNNLYSKLQQSLDGKIESHETKKNNSGSIKP